MLQLSIIIFRNTEERILLQFRDSGAPTAPLMWSFFGGVADSADETPEQAIVREVQEELHMDIAEEDLIKHAEMPWNETQEKIVHFFEYRHPITWDDIGVYEGAGTAFLSKEEIASMDTVTALAKQLIAEYC